MKVKHNIEPEFKPIEINITIESKEELAELYARLLVPIYKVKTYKPETVPFPDNHVTNTTVFWKALELAILNL